MNLTLFIGLILISLSWPAGFVHAASPIFLDGDFSDWVGQPCIPDPPGDTPASERDILSLCFANNPDESSAFFMLERQQDNGSVSLSLFVDTNNNGVYTESTDREIKVSYKPIGNHSSVSVELYTGAGQYIRRIASGEDWGESMHAGGARVEWGISFADLGIAVGQPVRFFAQTWVNNTPADTTVEVQWSPADALGVPLLAGILLAGSVWLGYRRMIVSK